jgi:hypothetical protein
LSTTQPSIRLSAWIRNRLRQTLGDAVGVPQP